MKIGLYFGSFNPVHNGHLIIATHIINTTPLNQVWFVVSPQNPFKKASSLLNEQHRLNLLKEAIEGETQLKACNIEFKLPRPSYTIDTLAYLKETFPQHEFTIIMGSDSYQNLPRWKNANIIFKDHEIYIYNRPGFEITTVIGKSIILDAPLLEISSTQIRELIKQKKSIRFLVPDSVKELIERNNYYADIKKSSPAGDKTEQ